MKQQIGCQFTKGLINAHFLVYINFMQESTQLYELNSSQAECNRIPTRHPYQKLKIPHHKTNQGLRFTSGLNQSLHLPL